MPILEVYADESSQTGARYMVIGAAVIEQQTCVHRLAKFVTVRDKFNLGKEMKWGKVSTQKLSAYKAFIDAAFECMNDGSMHYHCIVVDTSKLNHRKFNEGSRELGFSKFVYQLLMKFGRIYRKDISFHCYLDDRVTRHSPDELRTILNHGMRKKFGGIISPFKRVQFRDSSLCNMIQCVDIITGAVAWAWNERMKAEGASASKTELAEYIRERAGLYTLAAGTSASAKRFSIWKIQLQQ